MVPFVVEVVCAAKALNWGLMSCRILLTALLDFTPVSVRASACIPCAVICSTKARSTVPPSASSLCRTFSVAIVMVATHASCVGVHMLVPDLLPSAVAWVGVISVASIITLRRVVGDKVQVAPVRVVVGFSSCVGVVVAGVGVQGRC